MDLTIWLHFFGCEVVRCLDWVKLLDVHPVMLSVHFFFCLPRFLLPFTVSWRMVLESQLDLVTWPYHFSFLFLPVVRSSHWMVRMLSDDNSTTLLLGTCSMQKMPRILIVSHVCIHLCISTVNVHDSHAYKKMDRSMTDVFVYPDWL